MPGRMPKVLRRQPPVRFSSPLETPFPPVAMTLPAPILVGQVGNLFWMRVEGKGSFQNSVQVKRCFQKMIEGGKRHFVVDLERCPIMDSTFLGTLTGAA